MKVGLTAIDPQLLIFDSEDWRKDRELARERIGQLLRHRRFTREYNQPIGMSTRFSAVIIERFPWQADTNVVPELRDLRQLILGDFSRLDMIDGGDDCDAEIADTSGPPSVPTDAAVAAAWEGLLAGCALEGNASGSDSRVATWESTPSETPNRSLGITLLCDNGDPTSYLLRVVWDENSWYSDLAAIDWWPDLQRAVKLAYATSPALRGAATQRPPFPFSFTETFMKGLDRWCIETGIRKALVEALAKLVHGVRDKGLGDEAFKGFRRFRVTRFWRVHYVLKQGQVVLLEFGPHDIGM